MTTRGLEAKRYSWKPPRIARSMRALLRFLLLRQPQRVEVPCGQEVRLPKGCAFAVRHISR